MKSLALSFESGPLLIRSLISTMKFPKIVSHTLRSVRAFISASSPTPTPSTFSHPPISATKTRTVSSSTRSFVCLLHSKIASCSRSLRRSVSDFSSPFLSDIFAASRFLNRRYYTNPYFPHFQRSSNLQTDKILF